MEARLNRRLIPRRDQQTNLRADTRATRRQLPGRSFACSPMKRHACYSRKASLRSISVARAVGYRHNHGSAGMKSQYDVVILGAGHNGLVAAAYLARAGLSVLLLEKNDYIGGATTSQKGFPDYDAPLSRYSYLVSLFPEKIIRDLGLKLELRRRATGSFTPYIKSGIHDGLLISNVDEAQSRRSIVDLTGSEVEFEQT